MMLIIGVYGPKQKINQPAFSKFCDNLIYPKFGERQPQNKDEFLCAYCIDIFQSHRPEFLKLKIKLQMNDSRTSILHHSDLQFNISVLGAHTWDSPCLDLHQASSFDNFPAISKENLATLNKEEMYEWIEITNNDLMNGISKCYTKERKHECQIDVLDDIDLKSTWLKFYQRQISIFMFNYKGTKELVSFIDFYTVYDNDRFLQFIFLFQAFITIFSIIMFIYVWRKVKKYKYQDWLALHKWTLALLIAQAVLDDPYILLNSFFQNKFLILFSELGKNLHLTLLFYFWISVFEKIIFENIPYGGFAEWSERIKLILLTSIFIFTSSYYGYISIKAYENEYEDLLVNEELLNTVKVIIGILQSLYLLYFLTLMFGYIKLVRDKKIEANVTNQVLFIFTFISFLITMISITNNPESGGAFEYLAIQGFTSLYIITIAYLYVPIPVEGENENIEMAQKERDEIFKDVYEIEDENEEDVEEKEKEETEQNQKKLIWEKIQKKIESEDNKEEKEIDSDDDEYIYM